MKTCPACGAEKPADAFALNRTNKDGRAAWCRECSSAYKKGYRQRLSRARLDRLMGVTAPASRNEGP